MAATAAPMRVSTKIGMKKRRRMTGPPLPFPNRGGILSEMAAATQSERAASGLHDILDLHANVGLSVPLEAAIVLAAAEVLDHCLLGGKVHHLGDDLRARDQGLANLRVRS